MKKRRTRLKIIIWLFLAAFVFVNVFMWLNLKAQEKPHKINACETPAVDVPVTEKDYILDIPLSEELQDDLYEASQEFRVDYYVMVALIEKETRFCNVMGDNGNSYGYCQIQPRWWSGLMAEIGATDLTVPKDNFRTACAIMARLTKIYHSTEGALVAYNQGHYRGYSTQYSRYVIATAEKYRK